MSNFDLGQLQSSGGGLDGFFDENPEVITPFDTKVASRPKTRVKVASLSQLDGFVRVAENELVHKSSRDLWVLQQGSDGDYYIERQFDATSGPLKE